MIRDSLEVTQSMQYLIFGKFLSLKELEAEEKKKREQKKIKSEKGLTSEYQ